MNTKNKIFITIFSILILGFLISSGDSEAILSKSSVCCEKTISGGPGGYCITTDQSKCDPKFQSAPASCSDTSFCELGTCYDSSEGICMENTPQSRCINGTWKKESAAELPECQLGCCIISNQAAFVPLVRCKKLSSNFSVSMNYRTDIKTSEECIATAQSQDIGACTFEKDFETTCKLTTRKDCSGISGATFHKDYLCSSDELNTNCAKQVTKGCYQGKVYWFDDKNNRENVFSSDKVKSWNNGKIANPDEICAGNDGTNKDCGNCEYLLGSRCAVSNGDAVCRKNECKDENGITRQNGESWCVFNANTGNGKDPVGSEHFIERCIDGEIHVEPCAPFRQQICIENKMKVQGGADYSTAICRTNAWRDCVYQTSKEDCEDTEARDCTWQTTVPTGLVNFNTTDGICTPSYPPGFLSTDQAASGICALGNAKVDMTYKKGLTTGYAWECTDNCFAMEQPWALDVNNVCTSLGDCGAYFNYVGEYSGDGYSWKKNAETLKLDTSSQEKIRTNIGADMINRMLGK